MFKVETIKFNALFDYVLLLWIWLYLFAVEFDTLIDFFGIRWYANSLFPFSCWNGYTTWLLSIAWNLIVTFCNSILYTNLLLPFAIAFDTLIDYFICSGILYADSLFLFCCIIWYNKSLFPFSSCIWYTTWLLSIAWKLIASFLQWNLIC